MAFTFGRNWLAYSKSLDEARVAQATESVAKLVGVSSLHGLRMVDVGAGSGVFSIAAVRLDAAEVVALDRDADCVQAIATNAVRFLTAEQRGRLHVRHADVLRPQSLPDGPFDVVYAWGSLHHTGSLWTAIDNVARLCAPDGRFVLGIYNRTPFTPQWHALKRAYHAAPAPVRIAMVFALSVPRYAVRLARGRHPFRVERGMSVWYDSVDWLGGLPYEAASVAEVTEMLGKGGFVCETVVPTTRHGCNQFVFRRSRA